MYPRIIMVAVKYDGRHTERRWGLVVFVVVPKLDVWRDGIHTEKNPGNRFKGEALFVASRPRRPLPTARTGRASSC